jgi:hypothetical protein
MCMWLYSIFHSLSESASDGSFEGGWVGTNNLKTMSVQAQSIVIITIIKLPTSLIFWPALKSIKVGMARMPTSDATSDTSSTSTL